MHAPRLCLSIADDDLRSWIVEELLLMTWVHAPALTNASSLAAIEPAEMDVLVVDVDRLAPDERDALCARTWKTPVIAIGQKAAGLACTHVLGPRLTSRELKRALRATLFAESAPRDSAFG